MDPKFLIAIVVGLFVITMIASKIVQSYVKAKKPVKPGNQITYYPKNMVTKSEQHFFTILQKYFGNAYLIVPQVNLASIVNKKKKFEREYCNELFRNIDFGIIDKITFSPVLLIEINDKTHQQKRRIARDIKVKNICADAGIPLITFYTQYSNEESYVTERIKKELVA